MTIQPIGSFLPMDENGFILNDLKWENLQLDWRKPIEIILEAYQNHFQGKLYSVYLRGSVVRGLAVPFVSDIDTFALVESDSFIRWEKATIQPTVEATIQNKFPFIKGVEMNIASFEKDFSQRNPRLAMVLKTQSLCILGNDISNQLPRYQTIDLCLNSQWLEADLDDFQKKLDTKTVTKKNCQAIMKIIIRVGMEIVVEKEGKFTNDLYLCYKIFSKYFPKQEYKMRQALEYFLNPIDNIKTLNDFIKSFGNWLLSIYKQQ